jgi:hypothetical protein
MSEETDVAVSLLLVRGSGYKVDYLMQGREVDKSDLYEKLPNAFQPGRYAFYWPGAAALFGGHMNEGETPEQTLEREMNEELPVLNLTPEKIRGMELRTYNWRIDVPRVLGEAEEVFQGNLMGFFGQDLSAPVPSCALGKDRKMKGISYMNWMLEREPDHYIAMNIGDRNAGNNLRDMEGAGAAWVPHFVARSITSVPIDKIAMLDDMVKRYNSGELEIR